VINVTSVELPEGVMTITDFLLKLAIENGKKKAGGKKACTLSFSAFFN
jgi:hypothetical protein